MILELGNWLEGLPGKTSLLKHILIQFSCNDFLNANIKQLQNHEIKPWKTDLQTAHNRESPEGWRTGPHYMYLSCQSNLQKVSPMHTEQFVKIPCGPWDPLCWVMTQMPYLYISITSSCPASYSCLMLSCCIPRNEM